MTKEQAIAIIENEKECVNRANNCNRDCYNCELVKTDIEILTAYDMAIQALEQQPCDDCVSRAEVKEFVEYIQSIKDNHNEHGTPINYGTICDLVIHGWKLMDLPLVTPTHGTCKDCKHWKDNDEVYRRGVGAESKCPINNSRVFEGTFYCADFEKRGNENGSN